MGESGKRPLRLVPVWVALAGTFLAAISIAGMVLYLGLQPLDVHGLKSERELTSSTLFDLVKLSFGVVAGAGALVALVVAYRRQRIDEAAALREATRLHSERFTAAVEQLGSDSPAVQLGILAETPPTPCTVSPQFSQWYYQGTLVQGQLFLCAAHPHGIAAAAPPGPGRGTYGTVPPRLT